MRRTSSRARRPRPRPHGLASPPADRPSGTGRPTREPRPLARSCRSAPGWPTGAACSWATGSGGWAPQDGSYPATGFHTRGEMGGFWTPPIKLLDGIWFRAGDTWLTLEQYTSGWGYQRMDLGTHDGVRITRTDFAPDGLRAGLVGLRLDAPKATTVRLARRRALRADEGPTRGARPRPARRRTTCRTPAASTGSNLVFREQGTPPVANADAHDYAAVVGSRLTPSGDRARPRPPRSPGRRLRVPGHPGPDRAPTHARRCDDTAYGKGTGGQLHVRRRRAHGRPHRLVLGRRLRPGPGRCAGRPAARRSRTRRRCCGDKVAARRAIDAGTPGSACPATGCSSAASSGASRTSPSRCRSRATCRCGSPTPARTTRRRWARWRRRAGIGAGFPDYPWLFATDGEYTGFAAVTSGQFDTDQGPPARAARREPRRQRPAAARWCTRSRRTARSTSARTTTRATPTRPRSSPRPWRWSGAGPATTRSATRCTTSRCATCATSSASSTPTATAGPRASATSSAPGMGEEKLDNTVYTIRGLRDLADLAASKGDTATRTWATDKAADLEQRFDGGLVERRRHAAVRRLARRPGQRPGLPAPLDRGDAGRGRAQATRPAGWSAGLARATRGRWSRSARSPATPASSGCSTPAPAPTSAPDGNQGPRCDSAVSSVQSERSVFTLNTSIMAAAEAALGRMGAGQLRALHDRQRARRSSTRACGSCRARCRRSRPRPTSAATSRGCSPSGRWCCRRGAPTGSSGRSCTTSSASRPTSVATGSAWCRRSRRASRRSPAQHPARLRRGGRDGPAAVANRLRTVVRQSERWQLTIGAVLPAGKQVASVRLDGHATRLPHRCSTARGAGARGRRRRPGRSERPGGPAAVSGRGCPLAGCGSTRWGDTGTGEPSPVIRRASPRSRCALAVHRRPGVRRSLGAGNRRLDYTRLAAVPGTACSTTGCPRPRRPRGARPAWPRSSPPRAAGQAPPAGAAGDARPARAGRRARRDLARPRHRAARDRGPLGAHRPGLERPRLAVAHDRPAAQPPGADAAGRPARSSTRC